MPTNRLSEKGRPIVGKSVRRAGKVPGKVHRGPIKIRTNLYELVETVMDEAGSSDSVLVTSVVLRMLGSAKTPPAGAVPVGR
jgi:hypothetical protein